MATSECFESRRLHLQRPVEPFQITHAPHRAQPARRAQPAPGALLDVRALGFDPTALDQLRRRRVRLSGLRSKGLGLGLGLGFGLGLGLGLGLGFERPAA